ncbi:DegV family protein [Paenibacillus paeoniae]|uniref:DegV family protein n=1 Tax=Paenibacillus paeoniae TaxID=2292705 RepID=A0A371PPQ0_9BACL|nr:DegV family protein [Paenibacillus paeoniae]
MNNIRLFADSVSDLPQEWVERYNITIVPLYIIFNEEVFRDGIDVTTEEIYRRVEENGVLPRTAAPSPDDFAQAFQGAIDAGDSVLFISMSSKVSSTYQNARIAMNDFPEGRITLVDSTHLSASTTMLVIMAARLLEQGKDLETVVAHIESHRDRVDIDILVDRLDYLHKGGRVSSIQNMIGSLLKIRPVLSIKKGLILSEKKYRGKPQKALEGVMQNIVDKIDSIDQNVIVIAQTVAEEAADYMRNYLLEHTSVKEIIMIEGGCTIGSHTGPKTVAISYLRK